MPYDPTGYVSHEDELHRSQTWKRYCRAATTANITISTALNNGDSLDGVTLATGDRVLVKNQSTGSQNGIYVVGATPARAFDMDQDATTSVIGKEVVGAVIEVTEGTTNGGTFWRCTNTGTPVLGTTALTFAQFGSGTGSVTSVALTVPAEFSVSGSPVTSSGTLAVTKANESANTVWAGPTSGSAAQPTFRALVAADFPSGVGQQHILLADGHATPFTFDDLLQMDDGSDFMWSDPE